VTAAERRGLLLAGLLIAALPARAAGHLVSTGLGPVYDGLTHLLLSPEELLPAVALALLAGLRGAVHGRRALLLLPAGWLAGGAIGASLPLDAGPWVAALPLLATGALAAADAPLRPVATALLALALGAWLGLRSSAAADAPWAGWLALAGAAAALFMLVPIVAALVVSRRAAWARVAARVAGSWIAAVGLLQLGWSLRPD